MPEDGVLQVGDMVDFVLNDWMIRNGWRVYVESITHTPEGAKIVFQARRTP